MPGPSTRGALGRHPAEHPLQADQFADLLFVAQPVLEADGHAVRAQQMEHARDGRLRIGRFALNEQDIDRFHAARVGGGADGNMSITAVADKPEAVAVVDAVYVLPPNVDQGDVQPAFGQQAAKQASHCAGTDNGDRRFPVLHAFLLYFLSCRRISGVGQGLARMAPPHAGLNLLRRRLLSSISVSDRGANTGCRPAAGEPLDFDQPARLQ